MTTTSFLKMEHSNQDLEVVKVDDLDEEEEDLDPEDPEELDQNDVKVSSALLAFNFTFLLDLEHGRSVLTTFHACPNL